jgi:hypothetical protein
MSTITLQPRSLDVLHDRLRLDIDGAFVDLALVRAYAHLLPTMHPTAAKAGVRICQK